MKKLRKISRVYFLKEIVISWLILYMCLFMPAQVVMAAPNPGADALPSGLHPGAIGVLDPVTVGNDMTISQTASEAIMNWNNFDIGQNASVTFSQPGAMAAVLNRVHDGSATGIMGALNANGRVFIINPAGIVFGSTATVNVSQLVASGLQLSDEDFLSGAPYTFTGDGGMVANYGHLSAEQVALIGNKVLNAGVIQAPAGSVIMAAGDKVLLGSKDSDILVEVTGITLPDVTDSEFKSGDVINEGTIEASGGKIILAAGDTFSRAIEGLDDLTLAVESGAGRVGQFGTLNVDGIDGDGGSITLTAADTVVLGQDSLTTANAGAKGDGGEIVVFSPDTALFREGATVEAKGGTQSGNGGFFEVSGLEYVEVDGRIDLTAANGEFGSFLIDPRNIKIVDGWTNGGWLYSGGLWEPGNWWGQGDSGFSSLGIDKLNYFLSKGNVTLETDFWSLGENLCGGQSGWVIFDASKDVYTAPGKNGSLTVNALNYILFNKEGYGINFQGGGDVTLNAKSDITTNAMHLAGGNLTINAGGDVYANNLLYAAGNVQISATGMDSFWVPGHWVWVPDGGGSIVSGDGSGNPGGGQGQGNWGQGNQGQGHGNNASGNQGQGVGQGMAGGSGPSCGGEWVWIPGHWEDVYSAGSIYLADDVTAENGNLTLFNNTFVTEPGVTLRAGTDVVLKNSENPMENAETLTGTGELTIIAGNKIEAQNTVIEVTGSKLTLQQGQTLDVEDFLFANQGNTDLTLISTAGDVIATTSAGANAADKWASIGATAHDNIALSGYGSIKLGDSGTAGKSLYAINGDIDVASGRNVRAAADLHAGGKLKILAGRNIALNADAKSGDDMTLAAARDVRVEGDLASYGGSVSIYSSNYTTYLGGDVTAYENVLLNNNTVLNGGNQRITAQTGALTAKGDVAKTTGGRLTLAAGDAIYLAGDVKTWNGDLIFADKVIAYGNGDQMFKAGGPQGDLVAMDDIKKITEGSLMMDASDETIQLYGNVTAIGDIWLMTNTQFKGWDDQKVHSQNGAITADGYLVKLNGWSDGSLYLLANGDISLAGDVIAADVSRCYGVGGGVSIISETGSIFTPGTGGLLNVNITGRSDQLADDGPIGVDLPLGDSDGKAAIFIRSYETLNIGPDGKLTAGGRYYSEGVDDRAGINFLVEDVAGLPDGAGWPEDSGIPRDAGEPFDLAIYVGSAAGNVDVSAPVEIKSAPQQEELVLYGFGLMRVPVEPECDRIGTMVIDAYDTVTFDSADGGGFEASLAAGDVGDRLEVVSRISEWLDDAWNDGDPRLPYINGGGPFPDGYNYVLRGNDPEGIGAWVLEWKQAPVAPLAEFEEPSVEGCPVLVQAAAAELGIPSDTLQISIGNAMAVNPDIQPCQACAQLVTAAAILNDADGHRLAAMNQIFNMMAPADAPFTPEVSASIVTAFAQLGDQDQQYALAAEYVDAFVQYVAAIETELQAPVGDPVAFAFEKHGERLMDGDVNPNIGAYIIAQLASEGI